MRAFVPEYEMMSLESLDETLKLLAKQPREWKVFAGGTDLMVVFETGKLSHKKYLNINHFEELKKIEVKEEDIFIGAGATYTQIQNHPVIKKEFPLLVESSKVTGAIAIQNRGTIGGNIANMSPAADTPPSLLAHDADIVLLSKDGYRILSYKYFHRNYKEADLKPHEIIYGLRLKRRDGHTHTYYRKVGTRKAQAISKVCMAATARVIRHGRTLDWIHIGLGSIGPTPQRAFKTEQFLSGKDITTQTLQEARKILESEIQPIDDIRSEALYRRHITGNLLAELLEGLK